MVISPFFFSHSISSSLLLYSIFTFSSSPYLSLSSDLLSSPVSPVLFCPLLFSPVLSCPLLSSLYYPLLSCPLQHVLSCPVLSLSSLSLLSAPVIIHHFSDPLLCQSFTLSPSFLLFLPSSLFLSSVFSLLLSTSVLPFLRLSNVKRSPHIPRLLPETGFRLNFSFRFD